MRPAFNRQPSKNRIEKHYAASLPLSILAPFGLGIMCNLATFVDLLLNSADDYSLISLLGVGYLESGL